MSSIIVAAPKHRVSHPKGYRLHAIIDGIALNPEEVGARLERTPGGWYGPRDHTALEQARRSQPPEQNTPHHVERVLTHGCPEEGMLVDVQVKRAATRQPSHARLTNAVVDAWIRSQGNYTGPISKQIRDLARDVISHQESVRRYAQ